MNEILKKRIEEAANDRYADNTFAYKGFIVGAKYALSHQWIKVEEELPEYDETVIVALEGDDYCFCHRTNKPDVETDENGFCMYARGKILAWIPIPKFKL